MRTTEIIKEIQQLSHQQRIYVIEKTIRLIRKQEDANLMEEAADTLSVDYKSDRELTAFAKLDFEDFYETR